MLIDLYAKEWAEEKRGMWKLLCRQAFELKRVLFVMDGVDEAGAHKKYISSFITELLVSKGHRVVVTSRLEHYTKNYDSFDIFDIQKMGPIEQQRMVQIFHGCTGFFDRLFQFRGYDPLCEDNDDAGAAGAAGSGVMQKFKLAGRRVAGSNDPYFADLATPRKKQSSEWKRLARLEMCATILSMPLLLSMMVVSVGDDATSELPPSIGDLYRHAISNVCNTHPDQKMHSTTALEMLERVALFVHGNGLRVFKEEHVTGALANQQEMQDLWDEHSGADDIPCFSVSAASPMEERIYRY
jgi:hypothetical protein